MHTQFVVRKPEYTRSLERPVYEWKDNIKTDLKETGSVDVDWIHLAHVYRRMEGAYEHSNEP
jgi:hypothetical protein